MGWALRGSPQCARCRRLPESQTDPWYFRKMQVSMRDDWGSFIHGSEGLMGSHGPSSSAPSRTYPLGSPRRLEFCQYLWQHVSIINSLPLGFFYMPHIFEKLYSLKAGINPKWFYNLYGSEYGIYSIDIFEWAPLAQSLFQSCLLVRVNR